MNPIDIFIAYAEADKKLMERLRKQFSAAERIGLIDAWHDGEIEIGTDKEEASKKAMEKAEIVLLLLSADFFASEYLYEKEMTQALALAEAGKTTVIPVLLNECTWQLTPVANLQMLPKNEIPVSNEHWKHPDRAFKHVVDEVIRISNNIRQGNGHETIAYKPSEKKEDKVVVEKTIQKTVTVNEEEDKTPLRKIVIYAFLGLGAMALLSFLVDTFLTNPVPEPLGKDPITWAPEEAPSPTAPTTKTSFSTIKLNNLEWSAGNINLPSDNSWCYDNNSDNCSKLGLLYNHKAALQICPDGWRLPSKEEWLALSKADIIKLKLTKGGVYDRGSYRQLDQIGYYFTPENTGGDLAWVIEFRGNEIALEKDRRYAHWGMSCRCVR